MLFIFINSQLSLIPGAPGIWEVDQGGPRQHSAPRTAQDYAQPIEKALKSQSSHQKHREISALVEQK